MYSPLEQFEIKSIIGLRGEQYDFSLTNSSLYLIFVLLIVYVVFSSVLNNTKLVPSVWQNLLEETYHFIIDLINQNCGPKGQKYFPFMFVLFIFILLCNLLGMLPYSFTITSHFVITLTLSFSVWFGVTLIGLYRHGYHFFHLFVPSGAPAALLPALVVIECMSYIVRAFSLAVRLFANMMSGHTLLKIMAGFSFKLASLGGILGIVAAVIPLVIVFLITGLELGIAALQAYVFTILSIMYLNDAINLH